MRTNLQHMCTGEPQALIAQVLEGVPPESFNSCRSRKKSFRDLTPCGSGAVCHRVSWQAQQDIEMSLLKSIDIGEAPKESN